MNRILEVLQIIALIPITGGTLVLGALVAPILFANLDRFDAGSIMIAMFKRFDDWIKLSSYLLVGSKLAELALVYKFSFFLESQIGEELIKQLNKPLLASIGLSLAIAAASLHIAYKLTPRIVKAYEQDAPDFEKLHKQSELLHMVNFLLGVLLLLSF
jgi:hypothetical protein